MKEKTSVTLSPEVLAGIDRLAGTKHSRSAVIERVLRKYLREQAKAAIGYTNLEPTKGDRFKTLPSFSGLSLAFLCFGVSPCLRASVVDVFLYIFFTPRCLPFYPELWEKVFI